jgi:hypothetical protein
VQEFIAADLSAGVAFLEQSQRGGRVAAGPEMWKLPPEQHDRDDDQGDPEDPVEKP